MTVSVDLLVERQGGKVGGTADEPDQLWDLVVVHSRKRRGDVV